MQRQIYLTSPNSNDIYTLSMPSSLLTFAKYNFSAFVERSIALYRYYVRTGDFRTEETAEIRNSIAGCHKYYENNLRASFEKIVIDCWLEYICRENDTTPASLWNTFLPCRTPLEQALFARLTEFRTGKGINRWLNLLRMQEYAGQKLDFVFGAELRGTADAAARANYFDLMFNVTSNEMGLSTKTMSQNLVSNVGRSPNSPFVMSLVSKEIVRTVLDGIKIPDTSFQNEKREAEQSDYDAMEAFAALKDVLPKDAASLSTITSTMIKSMPGSVYRVYLPNGFKAVIDLEIDSLIESGGYLQKCKRCGEYYLKDNDYTYDYCDRIGREGRSCADIMREFEGESRRRELSKNVSAADIDKRCDELFREMSERVNLGITQRDFSEWHGYMLSMRERVLSGEATSDDFEEFVAYSRSMTPQPKKATDLRPHDTDGNAAARLASPQARDVKPFAFERVSSEELKGNISRGQKENHFAAETAPFVTSRDRYATQRVIRAPVVPSSEAVVIPTDIAEEAKPPIDTMPPRDFREYAAKPEPKREAEPEPDVKLFQPKKRAAEAEAPPIQQIRREPLPVRAAEYLPQEFEPEETVSFEEPRFTPEPPARQTFREREQATPPPSKRVAPQVNAASGRAAEVYTRFQTNVPPTIPFLTVPNITNTSGSETAFSSVRRAEPKPPPPPKAVEPQFAEVLKGFDRRDGFGSDDDIPLDADGVPVSHKTRRVMDVLFKQSKPSVSLGIGDNTKGN
ncbi:MAG: DUF6076 domain-containing protein [Oscillospiraceae bacterium]|jgi:hypothetical protein|nr:DUF6076 domain-containing protein [Oscillospiraceae bacterium]